MMREGKLSMFGMSVAWSNATARASDALFFLPFSVMLSRSIMNSQRIVLFPGAFEVFVDHHRFIACPLG